MPTYEYKCSACGKRFELTVSLAEHLKAPKPACPRCRAVDVVRTFSSVNVKTRSKTASWSG